MKPIHILSGALGFVLALAFVVTPAQAENRPYGELNFFQLLNGEVSRELNTGGGSFPLADGGGLSIVTYDAGIGCNTVATGAVYEVHCNAAGHFCPWGDGGCSSAIGSQNYGRPINASTATAPAPYYFTAQPGATGTSKLICVTPSASASMVCALFRMK